MRPNTLNIFNFFKKFISPISQNEDLARRESISNTLLITSIVLSFIVFVLDLIAPLVGWSPTIHKEVVFIIFSFFAFLYFLSRKGFSRFASYCLLVILFLPVTYEGYMWGIENPTTTLSYVLIIVMAGVLINTRFAFITTIIISLTVIAFGYSQSQGIAHPDFYWRNEYISVADVIVFALIFFIIATVSWLSNREIEKSLARARRSEADLKKERDSLEITVEERTRELKETQAEKMTQLYRFAEFGRLSSGLFHDLINPLTAVSLNIEKIKNADQDVRAHVESVKDKTGVAPISEVSEYVDKAVVAAKKMEDMVCAVRKQLSRQETKTIFSVNEEIAQALEVLSHKAQKSGVAIRLFSRQEVKTYGDAVKFNQVALNLIANAIESYLPIRSFAIGGTKEGQEKENADTRAATMSLSQNGDTIVFEVKDKGVGIPEENKQKLFEPFFTTKKEGYGIGIGLSMVKRFVEKDFSGSIEVESKEGDGAVFIVKIPIGH
jgi:signal transduction histidine kinase